MSLSLRDLDRARRDPAVFADLLVGRPLWAHQLEVVASPARYRVICAGRRSGKSIVFGVIALHHAFAVRGSKVLIVSAGDVASKRLFKEIVAMASAPLLGASVADETTSLLTLSNGSTVECVPSSIRQVRSAEADLLLVDEAGFVSQEVWEAAEPVILARPGSRVLLASSPWGGVEHFFRQLWVQGMTAPDAQVAAWHWPSSVSPLVDVVLLEQIRERSRPDYFAREYLAEWTDESGTYFTESELMGAVADYRLVTPEAARLEGPRGLQVGGGVDWGMARDANAVALVGVLDDLGLGDGRWRLFVPWLEGRSGWPWSDFIDRLCELAVAFDVKVYASETNGVGAYPTDDLALRLWEKHRLQTQVAKVWTDARRKQSGFGMLKSLLQQGRLVLPRHPELLKQLRALEFEQLAGGGLRIAVPERAGHDDLAMALMQAVSCLHPRSLRDGDQVRRLSSVESVVSGSGVVLPACPLPDRHAPWVFSGPKGRETGDVW
ncbi:MAG: terminase large subunit domain-containing protein [Dermatophilaceae bacterium]